MLRKKLQSAPDLVLAGIGLYILLQNSEDNLVVIC